MSEAHDPVLEMYRPRFEAGFVPMDSPPGFTERAYKKWKEAGGQVKAQPEAQPTWAVVHLMGHARYAGRLTEEEKFGCKMGRVDVPNDDGTFTTVYFGGASVYKIEVVTEAVARTVRRQATPQPVSPWDFPKQLPAATPVCPDCGKDEADCDCGDSDLYDESTGQGGSYADVDRDHGPGI